MKVIGIIAGAIVLVVIGFFALSKPADNSQSKQPSLTFASVQQDVKQGAKLYDVRTPEEFNQGHFASAVNFSLQDMQAGTLPDTAKSTKIYVYCHSGNRAGQAKTILEQAGYTDVTNLGGLTDMQALGGKLITE